MGGGNSNLQERTSEDRARDKAIVSSSDDIRNQDFESAVIIDDKGDIVKKIDGANSFVGSDEFDDLSRGLTVVHNHPHDGTFTPSDVYKLVDLHLRELYAVGPGFTYLIRPSRGRRLTDEERLRFYREFDRANGSLRGEAEKEVVKMAMTNPSIWENFESHVAKAWEDKCHRWLQDNSKAYGFEYSRKSVKGGKKQ